MKKSIVVLGVMLISAGLFAQNSAADLSPQCAGPIQNETLGLNCSDADTLSLEGLETCDALTVKDMSDTEVDSYRLVYQIEQDLLFISVENNRIPKSFLEAFRLSGARRLLAENVIGIENGKYVNLGYRWFDFY